MLNMTTLGLYMILASVTGTPVSAPVTEIPKPESQVVENKEDKTKKEIAMKAMSTEAYIRNYFSDIPILAEVARCESSFRQTDSNGNLIRGKVNRSDVGVMQINEHYHAAAAKKLGLDLHTLEGNAAYARELYEKEGAKPWLPSSPCWTKTQGLLSMRTDSHTNYE